MGTRRFLNLLVAHSPGCTYSLRRFDLSRNQFFYQTPEEVALHGRVLRLMQRDSSSSLKKTNSKKNQPAASDIKTIRLPAPIFNMQAAPCPRPQGDERRLDAFALSESSIVLADRKKRVLCYDAASRCTVTMPGLHGPKVDPLAICVPPPGGGSGEGSLYVIERLLRPKRSFQFEALVSREHSYASHPCRTWQCQELPPPPLEEDVFISSCAVVGNFICITVSVFGTYCFDTVSHVGDWALPFFGTAEYVPELNLWFGVDYHLPCAADLSPVLAGQQPEPALVWADNHLPEEWHHSGIVNPAKMVSLGSGRFCIMRFLETRIPSLDPDQVFAEKQYVVFTGLEVVRASKGKHKGLRMVRHKSRRCRNISANFVECLL